MWYRAGLGAARASFFAAKHQNWSVIARSRTDHRKKKYCRRLKWSGCDRLGGARSAAAGLRGHPGGNMERRAGAVLCRAGPGAGRVFGVRPFCQRHKSRNSRLKSRYPGSEKREQIRSKTTVGLICLVCVRASVGARPVRRLAAGGRFGQTVMALTSTEGWWICRCPPTCRQDRGDRSNPSVTPHYSRVHLEGREVNGSGRPGTYSHGAGIRHVGWE